ncbi:hypothetical protein DFH09DRAFT_270095, partial [Mycena vulgaris]
MEKRGPQRFFKAKDHKESIKGITDSVADQIRQFTFYGNISIEKSVGGILNTLAKETLAKLKWVPARYNSDSTPNECMPGTRVDIINDILARLTSPPDPSQRLVILSGVAGSGKSTIAKSIATILAEQGILAASFFFSRDYVERKEIKHLAPTLAIQLADYDTTFRTHLVKFLEDDRTGITTAEPRLQFQKMLIEILGKLPPSQKPWIICLDALDECGTDRGQIFLRWLSDSIVQIPVHIRFLLTGRPDVPSYLRFDSLLSLMHGITLDKIDTRVVEQDIHLYIKKSLDGSTWTTRHTWKIQSHHVEEITNRASGLFVFAATAVRYVLAGLPQTPPQKSVDYLLGGEPLTDLHGLYLRILEEAIPSLQGGQRAQESHDEAIRILSTILWLLEPLDSPSLAALLDVDMEVLQGALLPLSAVIHVSDSPGVPIQFIHLSFREFITSHVQATRPDIHCVTDYQQESLAFSLLRAMQRSLRFNICNLPTSYLRNVEMPGLQSQLDKHIPGELQYACRFWVDHLVATSCNSRSVRVAEGLVLEKFLFWLEVLSLLGIVDS